MNKNFDETLYKNNCSQKLKIINFSGLNKDIYLTTFNDKLYDCFRKNSFNYYEEILTEKLKNIIKKDFVIIDGGSNVGVHSITMSILGKEVYSFEPNIYTYNLLLKNIDDNNINNIKAIKKGLNDTPQILDVHFKSENFFENNCGAFTIGSEEQGENIINIDLITIDSLNLDRLDLIKLDIEGYVSKAIKGGLNTIKKYMPIIILECWVNPNITDDNNKYLEGVDIEYTKKYFDFLIDVGYNIDYINGSRAGGSPDFIFTPKK